MDPAIVGVVLLLASIVLYVTELFPLAVTTALVTMLMGITGACKLATVFSGWGHQVTFMVLGMFIVGDAFFATGAARYLGNKLTKIIKNREKVAIVVFILVTSAVSAFLSNVSTVAMMLPVVGATCAGSQGKLLKKYFYMPIGFAAIAGGGITIIGTPCLMVASGLLEGAGLQGTSFWEWALTGVPKVAVLLVFYLIIGLALSKKIFTFPEVPDAEDPNAGEEPKFTGKAMMATAALVFCIVGMAAGIWNSGVVTMVAACVLYATRCVNYKESIKRISWDTIIIVGFVLGFSSCLKESGAGELIAQVFIKVAGPDVNHMLVFVLVALLASFIGSTISSTPAVSILGPIVMSIAPAIGMDPRTLVIAVAAFATVAYFNPIGNSANTPTLAAGYSYMDYVKVGGLLQIITLIVLIVIFPFFYPLSL